jgi:branched-chain amino acid transport system ATP-binding protein
MKEKILTISALNAGYGKIQVLYDVSLNIERNSITAIVGPNGSGKSTLLKTIVHLTDIYSGSIVYDGVDITKLETHEIIKLGIAYIPQIENVFSRLTVKENLALAGYFLSKEEENKRIREILDVFPELTPLINRKVQNLSGGQRQILAMAMALMQKPSFIILDEPTTNLAPRLASIVYEKILELNKMGITFLVVEQAIRDILRISHFACLLVEGRVRFYGKAKELLEHPELGKLYLGIE